jgi:hypothetical protein
LLTRSAQLNNLFVLFLAEGPRGPRGDRDDYRRKEGASGEFKPEFRGGLGELPFEHRKWIAEQKF